MCRGYLYREFGLRFLSENSEDGEKRADLAEVITESGSAFLMMAKGLINGKDR